MENQVFGPEDVAEMPKKDRMKAAKKNVRKALKHAGLWNQQDVKDFFGLTYRQASSRMTLNNWTQAEINRLSRWLLADDKAQLFNPKGFKPQTDPKEYDQPREEDYNLYEDY